MESQATRQAILDSGGPELLAAARRVLPGGALGTFLPPEDLEFVVARGEGSRVFDPAGRA